MGSFQFPQALLSQINECSTAYLLVTVDEAGDFHVYQSDDPPLQRAGMANFVEILGDNLQEELRNGDCNNVENKKGHPEDPDDLDEDSDG